MSKLTNFAKGVVVAFTAAAAIGGSVTGAGFATAGQHTGFQSQWEDVLYVPGGFNKLACEQHPGSGTYSRRFNAWVSPSSYIRTCASVHYEGWQPYETAVTFAPRQSWETPPGVKVTRDILPA